LIESIERHLPNLIELNFSKNELGLDGAKKLASRLPKMKKLKSIILANCNMGDRGCIEVMTAVEDLSIDYLDLSGNQIGKSAHFNEFTAKFVKYLEINHTIETVILDDNNLRGLNGEKMLRQLVECSGLKYLSLSKNFLG